MSEQEPIDELPPDLRMLLDTAREPLPLPPDLEDRMLRGLDARVIAEAAAPSSGGEPKATPRRGPFFRAPAQTLLGFLLGAALGALVYRYAFPPPPPRETVRERVVLREREVRVEVPAPPRAAPPPSLTPVTLHETASEPAPRRRRSRDDDDDLRGEQALIDPARIALRSDAASALRTLDVHAARYRHGQLAAEREYLRARALAALGRRDEARAVAARFRQKYPRHALLPALEAALR